MDLEEPADIEVPVEIEPAFVTIGKLETEPNLLVMRIESLNSKLKADLDTSASMDVRA